jgi:hypothetical protein
MAVLPLRDLPEDVKKYILQVQGETKSKKGISQYSQEKTIIQIIREHKMARETVKS